MIASVDNARLARWLSAVARGDTNAFEKLYDATSPYVFAVAIKLLNDKPLAEDVLQEAYVQVWHRAADYHRDRGGVRTWVATIVRYRAIDLIRRRNTQRTAVVDPNDVAEIEEASQSKNDDAQPLAAAMSGQDSQQLRECMDRLSGTQRRSVYLAFFHGLTHSELAKSLSEPLGTVKSRLRRSLTKLKNCLTPARDQHEISG
ncbi:MAG: sigma-70 family RNA polymerase sigma factor [Gammaproteobacteria bacterium]